MSGLGMDDQDEIPHLARPTKGELTRARLLIAGRRVFERSGYFDARIVDIAAEAEIAVGSFYTYFDSKDELLREIVTEVNVGMFSEWLDPSGDTDPADTIADMVRHFLEFYRETAELQTLIESVATITPSFRALRLQRRRRSIARSVQAIEHLKLAGLVDQDLNTQLVASALGAMLANFSYVSFVLGENFDIDESVFVLTDIWIKALGLD